MVHTLKKISYISNNTIELTYISGRQRSLPIEKIMLTTVLKSGIAVIVTKGNQYLINVDSGNSDIIKELVRRK